MKLQFLILIYLSIALFVKAQNLESDVTLDQFNENDQEINDPYENDESFDQLIENIRIVKRDSEGNNLGTLDFRTVSNNLKNHFVNHENDPKLWYRSLDKDNSVPNDGSKNNDSSGDVLKLPYSSSILFPTSRSIPAKEFLELYDSNIPPLCYNKEAAIQDHLSDKYNVEKARNMSVAIAKFENRKGEFWWLMQTNEAINIDQFTPKEKEKLNILKKLIGEATLRGNQFQAALEAKLYLEESYRERFVPMYHKETAVMLEDDINKILSSSNSSEKEKLYYWKEWHKKVDSQTEYQYQLINQFLQIAANDQQLKDGSELLMLPYENEKLKDDTDRLWNAVKKLHRSLKSYVQGVLKNKYKSINDESLYIPAHLTGSLSGGDWTFLYNDTKPYPCIDPYYMRSSKYLEYCKTSQHFRIGMGMEQNMSDCDTLFTVKDPKDADCRPRAYEFCHTADYSFSVCKNTPLDINFGYELEKLAYLSESRSQPVIMRDPHPVIRDALSYLLTLQVKRFGANNRQSDEADINQLMYEALYFLPKIAYAKALTEFNWQMASGLQDSQHLNIIWWHLRRKYERVMSPKCYSQSDAVYDPAANYDIVMGNDKTADILSPFVMFQMMKALCSTYDYKSNSSEVTCNKSSKFDSLKTPLYKCSLKNRMDVGEFIKYVESLGRSVNWRVILKEATGSDNISPEALLEYFEPLQNYLKEANGDYARNTALITLSLIIAALVVISLITTVYILLKNKKKKTETLDNAGNSSHETYSKRNTESSDEILEAVSIEQKKN